MDLVAVCILSTAPDRNHRFIRAIPFVGSDFMLIHMYPRHHNYTVTLTNMVSLFIRPVTLAFLVVNESNRFLRTTFPPERTLGITSSGFRNFLAEDFCLE